MTPQEIQALINAKIAGQGSAVDVGGALPQILSGILELAQSGTQKTLKIIQTDESLTVQQALSCLELDGKTPTIDEIQEISPGFVVDAKQLDWGELLVTFVRKNESLIDIALGGYNPDRGEYGYIHFDFVNEDASFVSIYEV